MKCVICKVGKTQPGKTTVTLERGSATVVFNGVPARLCENCGEAYIDTEISRHLLERAEVAVKSGVTVEVREFAESAA